MQRKNVFFVGFEKSQAFKQRKTVSSQNEKQFDFGNQHHNRQEATIFYDNKSRTQNYVKPGGKQENK